MFNLCRAKGIQGSNTDFLICAVAVRHDFTIFTTDGDFRLFAKCLPIVLYESKTHAEPHLVPHGPQVRRPKR
jgi:predicted nucleic acid-binding protein